MEGGAEISRGLIVARGEGAELFEFAEEILDQVACLVERLIELAGRCPVLPRRGLSRGQQEAQRIAEGVDQGRGFWCSIRPCCGRSLDRRLFWGRRRCAGRRARWCCQSSHIRYRPRPPGARSGASTPLCWPTRLNACACSSSRPTVPANRAKEFRHGSGRAPPRQSRDCGDTDITGFAGQQVLDSFPLVIAKCISVHGSALFQADSS
jgi:hypothetical protein